MGSKSKLGSVAGSLCVGLLALSHASAATITYTGTLSTDSQQQSFSYTLAQISTIIFETDSYGGGISNGASVAAGGFVPVLSLFNSTGVEIGSDGGDATCYAGMKSDPTTRMCDDSYLSERLAAGTYTLVVTEFFNVPVGPNLSNGFLEQGQGNFTGSTCGTTGGFYETDVAPCVQRTNLFSIDATATPEPSTMWLGVIQLIFLAVAQRRTVTARALN